jgi:hypothetical protein
MEPLSREQIQEIHKHIEEIITDIWRNSNDPHPFYVEYARAIERAHGIGE